tara:strand:+ start:281 stop:553 length:273 start_codon:yes stop_codon:yes gene_type:complete
VKDVSEFKEMLNPIKLANTAKINPNQVFFEELVFGQEEVSFGDLEVIETIDPLQLYRHILPNHYTLQCNLKCDQCDFSTTTTTHLKSHLT